MKTDIILCGVGGQGILSIATIIGQAATLTNIHLKQAEVHGMSQRGGDVESDLRLSDKEIWSDRIPKGCADVIISMEPMEALRYVPLLSNDGVIITSSTPYLNIPNYPSEEILKGELSKQPRIIEIDIETMAREEGNPKGANMALLGAAAKYITILPTEKIRQAISQIFSVKGEDVVKANLKLFDKAIEVI